MCLRHLIRPLVVVLILSAAQRVSAADNKAESGPSDTDRANAALISKVLPELNFQDVAFDDVIDYLRDVSGFQAVIVRDAGVPEGQPVIRMRLKAVPLGQVLQVLSTAHPEISIQPVDNPQGPAIQVIRIRATEQTDAAAREGPRIVRVYPLANEIGSVLRARGEAGANGLPEKEAAKKGMDHVLSLVKTVVEAAGDRAAPTLAVHEETQSLIVTGTHEQHARVQDTLAALRGEPRPYDQQQNFAARAAQQLRDMKAQTEEQVARLRRENQRLEQELAETRDEARKVEAEARLQAIESERMQVRLEEAVTRGGGERSKQTTSVPTPGERPGSPETGSRKSGAK